MTATVRPAARDPCFNRRSVRIFHDGDLCIAEVAVQSAPDLLALAAHDCRRYPFLLESSAGAAAQSRYDLLLACPGDAIEVRSLDDGHGFFDRLDGAAQSAQRAAVPGLPFVGGWFVYLSYEMAGRIEPTVSMPRARDNTLGDALAVRCPAAIVYDRLTSRLQVVAEDNDHACVAAILDDLFAATSPIDTAPLAGHWREPSAHEYIAQVERARELIHAGDVFQVNLSRAWRGRLACPQPPSRVHAALRAANPAPFSALLQWHGVSLSCSSPERLLLIDDGIAQTRPIAGTRVRTVHADNNTDDEMTRELLAHPKERAEHVMLIDLERNDLGRICVPGSIHVDELMITESYAHVHHIVSNIRGRLAPDVGPGQALAAVFPGGTITGCPKVRCMQIIAQLEGEGRGAYTGSVGYLSRCGRMDSNIVIRSLTQQECALTLRTGAGIVADSNAQAELEETRVKARGVLRSFVDDRGAAYG